MNARNLEVLVFEERKGKPEFSEKKKPLPDGKASPYVAVRDMRRICFLINQPIYPLLCFIIPMNLGPVI